MSTLNRIRQVTLVTILSATALSASAAEVSPTVTDLGSMLVTAERPVTVADLGSMTVMTPRDGRIADLGALTVTASRVVSVAAAQSARRPIG